VCVYTSIYYVEYYSDLKKAILVRSQWLKPVILATGEAEIRRITVRGHLGK
jgi:hypothetical protein